MLSEQELEVNKIISELGEFREFYYQLQIEAFEYNINSSSDKQYLFKQLKDIIKEYEGNQIEIYIDRYFENVSKEEFVRCYKFYIRFSITSIFFKSVQSNLIKFLEGQNMKEVKCISCVCKTSRYA